MAMASRRLFTSFCSDGNLDEEEICRNVARRMIMPLRDLVVLGSDGEALQIEDIEADWLIDIVRSEVSCRCSLIAGTERESTKAIIAAVRRAAAASVDAVLEKGLGLHG